MVVAEFVKGDIDAGRFGQALKTFGPAARALEFAEGVGKYQVIVFPGQACGLIGSNGCRLVGLVLLDLQNRDFRQRQNALAGDGFGVVEHETIIGDDDGPLDADAVSGEIEVYPLQA